MKIATREAFGKALVELKDNPDVVVLDADLAGATKSAMFAEACPERFFNIGIAEQDMISTAAGLALSGKIPFACTFSMFATGRAYDQVRNSVAYANANVKVVGTHSGISVGEDGGTHQIIEDLALMRSIPNMTVIHPSDAIEAREAVKALAEFEGPAYLRLSRVASEVYHDEDYKFEIGKGEQLTDGEDVAIIATGLMVPRALEAAKILEEKHNLKATVVNIPTIKPLDTELIHQVAERTGAVVTAEEHNVHGGLGSAVSEYLSQHLPTQMKMVGIQDKFGQSGNPEELFELYGLLAEDIVDAAKEIV